ncbi:MAG TPA: sulfatase-like hydrolase/transferase [Candidatus Bathyarchaeia archaeon]|nr:sulfatase-like hydrolase/transferase [Candidatus Bathyarchaeia archaeon]
MVIALYIFCLAGSAGLFGSFIRQALGELGYVRGIDMALALAGGAGFLYAFLQLAYMTVLRVLKPTSSPSPLIAESLSQASAVVFLPYLLALSVNWPHPVLAKLEPLVYFGLFAVLHLFFKLVSFYASIRGERGGRLGTGGWLLAAMLNGVAAYWLIGRWISLADAARPQAVTPPQYYRVGDQYAAGRELPEGATVAYDVPPHDAAGLTLRWAPVPTPGIEPPKRIYVSARLIGDESEDGMWPVTLDVGGWGELNLSAATMPPGLSRCEVGWERNKRPAWQRLLGMRPLVSSSEQVLFSGPFLHEDRAQTDQPNFLIILVDGLASGHVSAFGYKRKTTPSLDALIRKSLAFPNAYSAVPETAPAAMTLLTGVGPLRHGYLGAHAGPLPDTVDTLAETLREKFYLTAAFTEGEDDLAPGSGFEQGYEIFDASYAPVSAEAQDSGSRRTLEKASKWLERHAKQKFFLLVRLRELGDPVWSSRYAPGFAPKDKAPAEIDVYDSALAYIDKRIGSLVSRLRSTDAGENTCIVVTSPYGIDFSAETGPVIGLTEESLRVPLIVYVPGGSVPALNKAGVGLDCVVPTLLATAGTSVPYTVDGADLAGIKRDMPAVSVYGSPAVFSMRRDRWRFYWHSGREPFTNKQIEPESKVEAIEVAPPGRKVKKQTDEARKSELAAESLARFRSCLQK